MVEAFVLWPVFILFFVSPLFCAQKSCAFIIAFEHKHRLRRYRLAENGFSTAPEIVTAPPEMTHAPQHP
jgi:hypothetical protein